jgi:hypothetical protein
MKDGRVGFEQAKGVEMRSYEMVCLSVELDEQVHAQTRAREGGMQKKLGGRDPGGGRERKYRIYHLLAGLSIVL